MVHEVPNRKDLLAATTHPSAQGSSRSPERNVEEKGSEPQPAEEGVQQKDLQHALSRVREVFHKADPRLEFSIDPDLDRVVVKVMNGESGEVIRQIPQQEIIELAKRLESPTGLLLHHKV
ncbi:flagellar protein FlaG [Nitrospirales bacterium NOB]|nr:hypothetical protein [Nitrospirota bacterium]MCK6498534.1 flagellar protein FlaG [Nitrospira sp.]MDL1890343.1 flagellar protein FlaG [Nitrospirales bacterium NOB]MEB2338613.1 flagellar protein FlaG [Nitrospirales bacterium]QOJ33641.1 MAG: flagellar protein FlaG [Nitrospira sp.]